MYVSNFAETRKLPFKVALDTAGDAARLFDKVEMTPTTFVINKQGQIIKRYLGEPNFAELSKLLDSTLAEAS
ncbi:peroxiredoxin family protein, partial [Escherichia coli]|uniref:peroxiredoxin family protein n=1 Tax=Escherichia coli TaxID=562 RepID=UPI0039E0DB54